MGLCKAHSSWSVGNICLSFTPAFSIYYADFCCKLELDKAAHRLFGWEWQSNLPWGARQHNKIFRHLGEYLKLPGSFTRLTQVQRER